MSTTLMQLRRLTRSRLGVPVSDDFVTEAVLDDHINLALQAVEAEYRWPWAERVTKVDVTADAPDIPLPANWRATRAVFDGDNELYIVAPGDILQMADVVGEPRLWCPFDDVITVRPATPGDRTFTHYWYVAPAWLSSDTDKPSIPDQFMGAIVAKAAELLSSREGAGTDASRHVADYQEWINRMRRDVRRSTPPTTVRVRPGGWI